MTLLLVSERSKSDSKYSCWPLEAAPTLKKGIICACCRLITPYEISGRSPTRLVLTILASALVVSLVTAAAAFVRGMGKSLVITSDQSNVILLAAGSEESIERSQIPGSTGSIVSADLSGIKTKFSRYPTFHPKFMWQSSSGPKKTAKRN